MSDRGPCDQSVTGHTGQGTPSPLVMMIPDYHRRQKFTSRIVNIAS